MSRSSVSALHGIFSALALRAPCSAPIANPNCLSCSTSRTVLRAKGSASSRTASAKVLRLQAGLSQKKRRTWSRRVREIALIGRSFTVRGSRLCTREELVWQSGHLPSCAVDLTPRTMPSSEASSCSTTKREKGINNDMIDLLTFVEHPGF
jgi:hypothetical protein